MHKKISGKLIKKASIIITLLFIFSIFSGFIGSNEKEDKPISMDELSEGLRYDSHDPEITGYTSFKIDPPNSGTYTNKEILEITISVSENNTLNWESNIPIYCVYVKGGNEKGDEGKAFGYVYKYNGVLAGNGLHAIMKNDQYQGISHVTFYYKEQQPPQVTGTINVEKKLVDEKGNIINSDGTEFSIKIKDSNGLEKGNGKIKAGETKGFKDLPLGLYTISEESIPQGYELVSIDKSEVNLTDENKEAKVVITNKKKSSDPPPVVTGTINVEKKLVDANGNIINGDVTEFNIKVAGNDKIYEDKIKAGETKGFKDLPLGLYTISEESIPQGYELISIDKSEVNLTDENKEAKVIITNKRKSSDPPPVVTGTINVEKKLVDGNGNDIKDTENKFSIKLAWQNGREKVEVEEIKAGETKSFSGLPLGSYTISEESIPSIYELVGIDKSSVTLTNENKEAKVVITNRIKPIIPPPVTGTINVEKKLVDGNGNDIKDTENKFSIKLAGPDGRDKAEEIKAGETKSFTGLRLGSYTISEESIPSIYELVGIDKSSVTLTNENKEAKVVITNRIKPIIPPPVTGTINVEKKLVDENGNDIKDTENKFSIKLAGPDGRDKAEEIKAGETKSFTGLPLGAYIISEESIPSMYELVGIDKSSVTLTNENKEAKVVITNRIKPIIPPPVIKGTINVEKKLLDSNGNIINGDVTEFNIKLLGNDKLYEDKIKAGETKGFKELFLGAYTISEENMPQGYELVSIDKSEVNLTDENKEAKVIITNKKKPSNPPPDGGDDSDDDDDDEPSISYGAIGDYIWLDENEDGKQDANEKAIPDVKVILTKTDGTKVKTSTDSSGKYKFDNLLSGKYNVTVDDTTLPKELKATYELDGILDYAVVVELKPGEVREDVDFGYAKIKTDTIEDKVPEEDKDKPEDNGKVEEDKKPVDEKPIDQKPIDNKPNNNKIPQTGTENFNILLLGALTSIVSGIYIILSKKKDHMV